VTTEQQIIVAEDVTQEESDKQQLHPMLEQAEEIRQAVEIQEEMGVALADAGYCSEENFTKKPAGGAELLVATHKDYKQRKGMSEQPPPEEPIPDEVENYIRFEARPSNRCLGRLKMFAVLIGLCNEALRRAEASGR
jgi:hypothetical protein